MSTWDRFLWVLLAVLTLVLLVMLPELITIDKGITVNNG